MIDEIHISARVAALRIKASLRYRIAPERCHIGHIVLQAMLERPYDVHQIDGATGASETNVSVANRSMQLADAMRKNGLQVGDHVVIMGNNHLDLCIPFFASHYNGYSLCAIDPMITLEDLKSLFNYINPKIVFCPKDKEDDMKEALEKNFHSDARIVFFDDKAYNMQDFIEQNNGTSNIQPAIFDQSKTTCWLMLTSGTTGLPKVAIIPYDTLLDAVCSWWLQFTEKWHMTMAMATIQWMSSLLFFISTPLMGNVRLQSSAPITPSFLVNMINKYKPNATAWTPYLLGQFLEGAGNYVDLSCFKYIAIGGSAIEEPLYKTFSSKCSAYLYLVYGMTELLGPVFDFNKHTPFGSAGQPCASFQYRLVGEDGEHIAKPHITGELWIKGDTFFKGYLNNPEETANLLTSDGWLKTGDIFYRDEENYYYFVERKRLLIKYTGFWISPLQLENVIKKHPGVAEVCVVGIADQKTTETPVAAIVRKNGSKVQPREIFDLVKNELPEIKQIHGGIFFIENMPQTPSGKIHRARVKEMALRAQKIYPNNNKQQQTNITTNKMKESSITA